MRWRARIGCLAISRRSRSATVSGVAIESPGVLCKEDKHRLAMMAMIGELGTAEPQKIYRNGVLSGEFLFSWKPGNRLRGWWEFESEVRSSRLSRRSLVDEENSGIHDWLAEIERMLSISGVMLQNYLRVMCIDERGSQTVAGIHSLASGLQVADHLKALEFHFPLPEQLMMNCHWQKDFQPGTAVKSERKNFGHLRARRKVSKCSKAKSNWRE